MIFKIRMIYLGYQLKSILLTFTTRNTWVTVKPQCVFWITSSAVTLLMLCNGRHHRLFLFGLSTLHSAYTHWCSLNVCWWSLNWWVPPSHLLPCSLQVASGPAPYCHSPWPQQQEASPSLVIDKSGNYFITWRFP